MNEIELIKKFENCRLVAYLDSINLPTIGYGNTYYQNGTKVKMGDKITQLQAEQLLNTLIVKYADTVDKIVTKPITPCQRASLISLCWNIGQANLSKSTLIRMININPNDPSISDEFKKWSFAGKTLVKGLLNRRVEESLNYWR